MPAPSVTICSFRLGGGDGVSVEATKWAWAFGELGWRVRTLAGEGRADALLPGLAAGAGEVSWGGPEQAALEQAIAGADLVVVENLCSLPLNPPAAQAMAEALAGRPAILRHHDLASQRPALAHLFPPPDDPCWLHVTINELSAAELAAVGIDATVVRNRFDPDPPPGRRQPVRAALGVGGGERLLLHPVRAIARKNVPGAIDLAEAAGATYWLLGDAEDGYGPALESALAASRAPVLRGWPAAPAGAGGPGGRGDAGKVAYTIDDLYAACDGVLLPSTWEGFGNPSVEAATHDRPLAIGDYPVALELAALGFEFFPAAIDEGRKAFCRFLEHPDQALLARNHEVARRQLPLHGLPAAIGRLLDRLACGPVRSWWRADAAGPAAPAGAARSTTRGSPTVGSEEATPRPLPTRIANVVVENLAPSVDGGRFAVKATVGDPVRVEADVFTHGHDLVRAHLRWLRRGTRSWSWVAMSPLGNDRFGASFTPGEVASYEVEVTGGVDHLSSWRRDALRRVEVGRYDPNDAFLGAALVEEAADALGTLAEGPARAAVARVVEQIEQSDDALSLATAIAGLAELDDLLARRPLAPSPGSCARTTVFAQRELATCSAWYELFPRSTSPSAERPGTLVDLIERLDYVADLGFDVVYLPPIHPIGTTARKGRGNSPRAEPGDVGSPWAIGSPLGGHEAIAPELGTLEDFTKLLGEAAERRLELALDLVFTTSPDHPWVSQHPQWFRHRPDGTIACAENPPKLYEDTYPLDFDTEDRDGLWNALLEVTLTWVRRGVRIFRVDNPHTKPFPFWEWLIAEVRAVDPEVIFLAEAFTRPKVMHRLAKLGFDQSYTYFAWRDSKQELTEYFTELADGPGAAYFRPNAWPNTPDILAQSLQRGGRPAFVSRLVLAACLSASYGIYGPAFEHLWDRPAAPGSEEYLDSEKYEVKHWDPDDPASIRDVIRRVNGARRAHPALRRNGSLRFHPVDNEQLMCWSKRDEGRSDAVLCVVNLDPGWTQSGYVQLDLGAIGIGWDEPFVVHDLLADADYYWQGPRNFIMLDPVRSPAHLFAVLTRR